MIVERRPEPSYWPVECEDREQRIGRFEEAILHLPRPALVYTTLKEDARSVARRMHEMDFRRVACVTGDTADAERLRAIEAKDDATRP